ncbi:MAG: hypothetical protein NTU76_02400 [Candidatus Taylorbacteria bacterium]|nr:hypothetical protein [Candidatus Taylorbacteria bacterium]
MKKYLLGLFCLLILVSSLFVVVNKASALTSADIDMLVALGLISPDKADSAKAILFPVSTPTTPVVPPVVACKDILSRDLIVGSSDTRTLKDVSALQKFLGLNVTGYFGALTKSAVMKFQLENGVSPANGNVYSITRKFINEKNCKNTGQPIITSLSVNSGGPGTQVVIYGSNLYSSVAPYGVTFNDPTHDNGVSGTASTDGNSFTFIVPGSVSSGIGAGVYTITLENTLGQRSNSVSFTVTTSPQPTITITYECFYVFYCVFWLTSG